MHSIHAVRWMENLKDGSHELYYFDITDNGKLEIPEKIVQFNEWKTRKIPYIKGEHALRKKAPQIYKYLNPFLEITISEALENIIEAVKPDVIHSFEMQSCSYPIVSTIKKFPEIKWIYSCWGNDLFYYQEIESHKKKIKNVLSRVDYIHTDCERDFELAKRLGFKGKHLGVIPGGTGYNIEKLNEFYLPIAERKIILVKGYEHLFGRGLNIIKALQKINYKLQDFEIVIFGAHASVVKYVSENNLNFKVFDRHGLSHEELIMLMGKSLIYIGNSISDGMPNTLLEAIVMGAFPLQSNPGNVTAEIINDGENGFLIEDPENIQMISEVISKAIEDKNLHFSAAIKNASIAREKLDYSLNQEKVIAIYQNIEKL